MSAALFILQESGSVNAFGQKTFKAFQQAINRYNSNKHFVASTGPLSIPLVFSLGMSPFATGAAQETALVTMIQHLENLPEPYRSTIMAFHFFQLAIHGPYFSKEKVDSHLLGLFAPWISTILFLNKNQTAIRLIERAIPVVLYNLIVDREGWPTHLVSYARIPRLLDIVRRRQKAEAFSLTPFLVLRVQMGTRILFLNRGLAQPLDRILAASTVVSAELFEAFFDLVERDPDYDAAHIWSARQNLQLVTTPGKVNARYQELIAAIEGIPMNLPSVHSMSSRLEMEAA